YYKVDRNGLKRQTQSVFGNVELGWKSCLFVSATVRADWDSALAYSSYGKKAFVYPSVGISALFHEMFDMPRGFPFLKARFSYTSVGNAYDPYMTKLRYEYDQQTQQYHVKDIYPNFNLKPEITQSYEAGLNLKFIDNTLSLDLTYYHSNTKNQTFEAPLSAGSGYKAVYVQAGNIENQGFEAALGYDNTWGDFSWNTTLTASLNRNKIVGLVDGVENPVTGELISMPY
ncbi:protein containing TonB-dependent receptor, beta-barrel domain protein, partial [gut metagenome]